jgi:hypothetical protein
MSRNFVRHLSSSPTFVRAPIVREMQAAGVDAPRTGPWDWKWLQLFTWAASIGGGLIVASADYRGDKNGDHALRGLQRRVRGLYEDIIIGSAPREREKD